MEETNHPSNPSYAEQEKDPFFSPPFRFSTINPKLYRGAYPTLRNFRFLHRLGLKSILSLVPEVPTVDLAKFARLCDTNLIHIQVIRTGTLSSLAASLSRALNILLNAENYPIYIHCLDGRRVTSLLVLLLRRLQMWAPQATFSEYWKYQYPNQRMVPVLSELERITREIEKFALEINEFTVPQSVPSWLWNDNRAVYISGIKLRYNPPLENLNLQGIPGSLQSAKGFKNVKNSEISANTHGEYSADLYTRFKEIDTIDNIFSGKNAPISREIMIGKF